MGAAGGNLVGMNMRKRTLVFVVGGVIAAGAIWWGRAGLSHRALGSVVTSAAPTEEAMEEFVGTSGDEVGAVKRLWESHRLNQRLFVVNYLRKHAPVGSAMWETGRGMLMEAVRFGDSQFQEDAVQILGDHKEVEYARVVKSFLGSSDSEVRLAGVNRMIAMKDRAFAGTFAALLDDPDLQVRTIAAAGLRNLTGMDFGTRLSARTQAMEAGIGQWKKWWAENRGGFPEAAGIETLKEVPAAEAYGFELPSLEGRAVRLADYKGKVVLLNFWATWCPSCAAELGTLAELQAAHREDLVVLGINVDGVTDGDDHDAAPTAAELVKTRAEIVKLVGDAKVTYPILLDPAGKVLGAYAAGNLPTNVVIGADGTMRRRMLGVRSAAAWEQIIAAARR